MASPNPYPYRCPVAAVLLDLRYIEVKDAPAQGHRSSPSTPALGRCSPTFRYRSIHFQWWRDLILYFGNEGGSAFLALPTGLHVLIALEVLAAARASLALACRTLLAILSYLQPFNAIALPAEQRFDSLSPRMSKAQIYHPAGWELLRSLERDL